MISTQPREQQTEKIPTPELQGFDYTVLSTDNRTFVQQRTSEIRTLMRRTAQDIIDIGQKLIEVKEQLEHGQFRNWLKAEFSWSVSAATRFMQVSEQFKCANLVHLNISASALYLLASPSTPEEARREALKRVSQGENITYSKAKAIVSQQKKATKPKLDKPVTSDMIRETVERKSTKSIEQGRNETLDVLDVLVEPTGKKVETKTRLLTTDLMPSLASKDKHLLLTEERNLEQLDNTTPKPPCMVNPDEIAQKVPDVITTDIEIRIRQLIPEQLALVIMNSANNGLSTQHLEAIITAAKQALKQRNYL